MSRAFVKEDQEVPERKVRRRSGSGLPPGARNYLTSHGAQQLRAKIDDLRAAGRVEAARDIEGVLKAATIVSIPVIDPTVVTFGATVTLRGADGVETVRRIVGVDEVEFDADAVSWISDAGKALLGLAVGDKVMLEESHQRMTIAQIEYR